MSARAERTGASGLLAATLALVLLGPTGSSAEGDPQPCVEAIARHGGDEQRALREAEQAQWRVAREAERQARKRMRSTMGMGESRRSLRATARVEELDRRFAQAVQTARVLCGCRQRRGDLAREDCDRLYRRWLPPRELR